MKQNSNNIDLELLTLGGYKIEHIKTASVKAQKKDEERSKNRLIKKSQSSSHYKSDSQKIDKTIDSNLNRNHACNIEKA